MNKTYNKGREDSISLYSILKITYKRVLPLLVRKAIFSSMPRPLKVARARILRKLEESAEYDEMYDEEYYNYALEASYKKACEVLADTIVKVFAPKSVVDVGCGIGLLLLELKKRGVVCRGLEHSSVALNICRQNGLDVTRFDLTRDVPQKGLRADVVASVEVAEHLAENCADRFIDILCSIANDAVLTACPPACIFPTHFNEQPKEYWIGKFQARGFKYNESVSNKWTVDWEAANVDTAFAHHLMVFRKQSDDPI